MITEIRIDMLQDASFSLAEWKHQINSLCELYGEDAILFADGGYNNVSFRLIKSND